MIYYYFDKFLTYTFNSTYLFIRAMIFEQPFGTTYLKTFLVSLFIGQKQWREKKEERG